MKKYAKVFVNRRITTSFFVKFRWITLSSVFVNNYNIAELLIKQTQNWRPWRLVLTSNTLNPALCALPQPEFMTQGTFAVILQRSPMADEETKQKTTLKTIPKTILKTTPKTTRILKQKPKEKIVELIYLNDEITLTEMANILGITVEGVKYHMNSLKKNGIIDRKGPTHGGKWIILKKTDHPSST